MAQFTDPAGAPVAGWQPGEIVGLDAVTDPGPLCWTELHTTDPAAARSFYQAVFAWVTQDMPMGDFSYTVIQPAGGGDDSSQGGIVPLSPGAAAAGISSRGLPDFEGAACDAAVARVAQGGGTVTFPPQARPGL